MQHPFKLEIATEGDAALEGAPYLEQVCLASALTALTHPAYTLTNDG